MSTYVVIAWVLMGVVGLWLELRHSKFLELGAILAGVLVGPIILLLVIVHRDVLSIIVIDRRRR